MIVVTMNAALENADVAAKVVEVFGRVMAGRAFEGIFVSMNMQDVEITTPVGAEDFEGPS